MKLSAKTNRQLSFAVGILAFLAFIVQGLGATWGFEAVAKQLVATALLFSAGVNVYFLGSTSQKAIEENKVEDEKNEKSTKTSK